MSDQHARFQSLIEEACAGVVDERLEHAGVLLEAALDENFVPEVAEALAAIDRRRSGEAISRSEIVEKLRAAGADFARVEPSIKQQFATVERKVVFDDDVDDDIFGASIEVDESLVSGSFAPVGLNVSADDIDIFADEDFDSIASPVLRPASDEEAATTGSQLGVPRPSTDEHAVPHGVADRAVDGFENDDGAIEVDDDVEIVSSEPSDDGAGASFARRTDAFAPVTEHGLGDAPVVNAAAREDSTPISGVHETPAATAADAQSMPFSGTLEFEAPEEIVGRSVSTGATVAVDGVDAARYFEDLEDEPQSGADSAELASSTTLDVEEEFTAEPPSVLVRFDDVLDDETDDFEERIPTPTGRSTEPTEDFDVAEINELDSVADVLEAGELPSRASNIMLRPQTALQQPSLGQESDELIAAALESVERAILDDDGDDEDFVSLTERTPSSPRYSADSPPPAAHRQPSPPAGASSASTDDFEFGPDVDFDPLRDTYEGPPGSGNWSTASAGQPMKLPELSAPHLAVRPEVIGDSDAFEEVTSIAAESADDEVAQLLAGLDDDNLDGHDIEVDLRASTAAELDADAEPDRDAQTPLPQAASVVRHRRESSSRHPSLSTSGEYSAVSPREAPASISLDAELIAQEAPEFERLRDVSGLMKRGDLATAMRICDAVLKVDPDNSVANEHKRAATSQLAMLAMSRLEPLSRAPVGRPERAVDMADLTPRMMFVLTRADGHSTLDDLLDCSGLPRTEAAMVLVELYERGLIVD